MTLVIWKGKGKGGVERVRVGDVVYLSYETSTERHLLVGSFRLCH